MNVIYLFVWRQISNRSFVWCCFTETVYQRQLRHSTRTIVLIQVKQSMHFLSLLDPIKEVTFSNLKFKMLPDPGLTPGSSWAIGIGQCHRTLDYLACSPVSESQVCSRPYLNAKADIHSRCCLTRVQWPRYRPQHNDTQFMCHHLSSLGLTNITLFCFYLFHSLFFNVTLKSCTSIMIVSITGKGDWDMVGTPP